MSPNWRFIAPCSARLYPGKTVRAALIFTTGPVLMELPAGWPWMRRFPEGVGKV